MLTEKEYNQTSWKGIILYISDAMEKVLSNHSEYADDNTVWKSGDNLEVLAKEISEDGEKIAKEWCGSWNMEISTVKTKAMIIMPANVDTPVCDIKLKGESIEIVKEKKLLGITIDDQLKFEENIANRKLKDFKAIKGIDFLIQDNHGCSQDTYTKLYKSLVLPAMDYGAAAFVTATDLAQKEFGKVQRSALLKATGCMANTSLETLELVSNCIPMHLHLKLRQAEEMIEFIAKMRENKY